MIIEKPLYSQHVTVSCGFWAGGIIGHYFFANEAGAAVSVNGLRYRIMINEFLWPELEDMDVDDVYLQQDGATCHTSGKTIGLLHEKFTGPVMNNLILHMILYMFLCVFLYVSLYSKTKENISVCRMPQRETLKDPD